MLERSKNKGLEENFWIFDVILKGAEKPLRWDTHLGGTKWDFDVRTTEVGRPIYVVDYCTA